MSDKIILSNLKDRFSENFLLKEDLSIKEKYDAFSREIRKAFHPIIKKMADNYMKEMNDLFPDYLEFLSEGSPADNSLFGRNYPLRRKLEKFYASDDKEQLAFDTAEEQLNPDIWKTEGKLVLLEQAKLQTYHRSEFIISGRVFNTNVVLKQQVVWKTSNRGTDFPQFPARIYLDGKFTPEDVYKKWFKEKGEGVFKDIEDIRSRIKAQTTFKIGQMFVTEKKLKQKELKEGNLPIELHEVVAVDKDHITVKPLKVVRFIIADTKSNRRYPTHTAIYRWKPAVFDGEAVKWKIKSTPTKSTLIDRRGADTISRTVITRDNQKSWRGIVPTHTYPDKPDADKLVWKKTKKGYEIDVGGFTFDVVTKKFSNENWAKQELHRLNVKMGKRTRKYFNIPEDGYTVLSNNLEEEALDEALETLISKKQRKDIDALLENLQTGDIDEK